MFLLGAEFDLEQKKRSLDCGASIVYEIVRASRHTNDQPAYNPAFMPIPPGARIGPYEILSALGAGGMGEVYRARDTKLGRDVAIKEPAGSIPSRAGALARSQREAQLLASLNHPHIAAIYGFEETDGAHLLILELVDGRDTRRSPRARAPGTRRSADDRAAGGRGPRGGARERHHSPGPEARQHRPDARRHREDPGLRTGQGRRSVATPTACRCRRRSRSPRHGRASSLERPPI